MGSTKRKSITWEELLVSLNSDTNTAGEKGWNIYHYLNAHLPVRGSDTMEQCNNSVLTSEEARVLLAIYMKLPGVRPSLLHSCFLGVAVKMSEVYTDFRFPTFLEMWGYPRLMRLEDTELQTGKDGRVYLSLNERVERALQSYILKHPNVKM